MFINFSVQVWHDFCFLVIISSLVLPLKVIFVILLTLLILLVAYTRVYLGVHYLSDTIGAIFVFVPFINDGKSFGRPAPDTIKSILFFTHSFTISA